jgi:nucleotide-binding universal stress UspA family protein
MEALRTNTRIALNNILVTTDFSQASRLSLPYAMALARQYESKVLVAHAVSPEPHLSVPLEPMPPEANLAVLDAERNLYKFTREALTGETPCHPPEYRESDGRQRS